MNPHDADNAMAADYVMGLLDGAEQAAAERRIATDQSFAQSVSAWRERLAELDLTAGNPAEPGALAELADATKLAPIVPCPPHAPRCVAPSCGTTSVSGADSVSAAPSLQRFLQ